MLYNIKLFYLSLFFYLFAAYFFVIHFIKKNRKFFWYSKFWLLFATIFSGLFLLIRYRESSYPPLASLFEITFFYVWMMGILHLTIVKIELAKFIQSIFLFIIYGILIWSLFLDKNIHPLNPVLKSFWLAIHVPSAILSYSAFTLSFAISLYSIFTRKKDGALNYLKSLNLKLIIAGVILLLICIITGAAWAKSAWGRFWSWDPKEIWALFTFVIYLGIILMKKVFRLSLRGEAILSVLGFLAMLFTFFGVNLFLTSHHAY